MGVPNCVNRNSLRRIVSSVQNIVISEERRFGLGSNDRISSLDTRYCRSAMVSPLCKSTFSTLVRNLNTQPLRLQQRYTPENFDRVISNSCRRSFAVTQRFISSNRSGTSSFNGGYLDKEAIADLFDQYAKERCLLPNQNYSNEHDDGSVQKSLDIHDFQQLLQGIGRNPDKYTLEQTFRVVDIDGNGVIDSFEFLENADALLGDSPARIILVIGGPGSGKGLLSRRLQEECNVVHMSSGDLLRQEVEQQTALGTMVKDVMSRGELVSSALMVALMKKQMKNHPGKRVLLDGFPRSPENAKDLVSLCGRPELALHLVCDDTVLMERIMKRGKQASEGSENRREDDNFYAALKRLRTFHQFHGVTMEWLKSEHIPIINLDCSGDSESVWQQLVAIGRLMRPAVRLNNDVLFGDVSSSSNGFKQKDEGPMDTPKSNAA